MAKFEVPKARLPNKLPSKATESVNEESKGENEDEDENEDVGMWSRDFAKSQSVRYIRAETKRAARQSKLATDELLGSGM